MTRINDANELDHANTDDTELTPDHRYPKRTLDPIVTLLHPDTITPSASSSSSSLVTSNDSKNITSVCFLNHRNDDTEKLTESGTITKFNDDDNDGESDLDDSDDSAPLQLQCASLMHQHRENNNINKKNRSYYDDTYDLSCRLLVTCDLSGACYIWDIGRRQIMDGISSRSSSGRTCPSYGPGLTIRRLYSDDDDISTDHRFFYQTRDTEGTISLHDSCHPNAVSQTISCHSQSFTSAAPCHGNSNLIAIPCLEHDNVMVRDWRMSSLHHPVAYFHGGTGMIVRTALDDDSVDDYTSYDSTLGTMKKYGMVTSLAMSASINKAKTLIACGMENGSVVYHDLAMLASQSNFGLQQPCTISLSISEPILALDMVPSKSSTNHTYNNDYGSSSFVTVAGIAGNEEDLMALPEHERGRIAILKTSTKDATMLQARLRSRISTNYAESVNGSFHGKPGIGQCRFRPDGRLFAVGGWDNRVRIYDRHAKVPNATTPLAILRGHTDIVNSIDWSCDTVHSGLMVTGSLDGKVHIWRCFPSKQRTNK
jgi:WD domain, G-beta repeat